MQYLTFSWIDYALFVSMFVMSIGIGLFYGFCTKQSKTTSEYLFGGRKMKVLPVSVSVVASTLSGITLLSMPGEIYLYGTQFMWVTVTPFVIAFAFNYLYLPVFWKLNLTSGFEYLEKRFDKSLRIIASFLFAISVSCVMPIVIYVPSLAFNQVTGLNVYIVAVIMSLICIFYTSVGGLKAVVWADTLQFCFTLCTLIVVTIMGITSVGGLSEIWKRAELSQRIEFFNTNLDPTIRNSFWSSTIGLSIFWVAMILSNPGITQRFLAVPTLSDSRKVLLFFIFLKIVTNFTCCFSGIIIYAVYYKCDPLTTKQIKKIDQILPFYVMDVARQFPGLGGLFVAGIFSSALSTLSTSLNALSGIIYQDFISPFMSSKTSERVASNSMKIIAVVLGFICLALVFIVNKLGSALEIASSFNGCSLGPILGLFTLGVVFPIANKKGALIGSLFSLVVSSFVIIKYQIHVWKGDIGEQLKPLYMHGCNESLLASFNSSYTNAVTNNQQHNNVFWIFRMSYSYYVAFGMLITLLVGLIASWFTRSADDFLNPDTLCPYVQRFITRNTTVFRYSSVEKELHISLKDNTQETGKKRSKL